MAAELTLDSGALIAAEKRDRRFMTLWKEALTRAAVVTVPAVVLGQVWRGNSPVIARMLRSCTVEAFDTETAMRVGALLAQSRTSDIVDAAVVLGAAARGDRIVTSDPHPEDTSPYVPSPSGPPDFVKEPHRLLVWFGRRRINEIMVSKGASWDEATRIFGEWLKGGG